MADSAIITLSGRFLGCGISLKDRCISDKDDIEMINNLLKPWIKGLKYDL